MKHTNILTSVRIFMILILVLFIICRGKQRDVSHPRCLPWALQNPSSRRLRRLMSMLPHGGSNQFNDRRSDASGEVNRIATARPGISTRDRAAARQDILMLPQFSGVDVIV